MTEPLSKQHVQQELLHECEYLILKEAARSFYPQLIHRSYRLLYIRTRAILNAVEKRRLDLAHGAFALLMDPDPNNRSLPSQFSINPVLPVQPRLPLRDQPDEWVHRKYANLTRYSRLLQQVKALPTLPFAEQWLAVESMRPPRKLLSADRAREFRTLLWSALAEGLAGEPFNPSFPRLHAGAAWANAKCYPQARKAVESDPDWQRQPALIIVHADACWHTGDWEAARRDWANLCWQHPADAATRFDATNFPDVQTKKLWHEFGDTNLDTADFPAWVLLTDPRAGSAVPPKLAPDNATGEAYWRLHQLLRGEDSVAVRMDLKARSPKLFQVYLDTR